MLVRAAGLAALAKTTPSASNATAVGQGIGEFGMTAAYDDHQLLDFTYAKGFFCDTIVASSASSGCEVGQA